MQYRISSGRQLSRSSSVKAHLVLCDSTILLDLIWRVPALLLCNFNCISSISITTNVFIIVIHKKNLVIRKKDNR
jgi:hypothetical protein